MPSLSESIVDNVGESYISTYLKGKGHTQPDEKKGQSLKYWVDDWKFIYPKIGKKPEILGTLYNLGDSAKGANPKPKPNEFGKYVKKNYKFVKKKLK